MYAICVHARGRPSVVYESKLHHDSLERVRERKRKKETVIKEEGMKTGREDEKEYSDEIRTVEKNYIVESFKQSMKEKEIWGDGRQQIR